jgi:hypothetical protein
MAIYCNTYCDMVVMYCNISQYDFAVSWHPYSGGPWATCLKNSFDQQQMLVAQNKMNAFINKYLLFWKLATKKSTEFKLVK